MDGTTFSPSLPATVVLVERERTESDRICDAIRQLEPSWNLVCCSDGTTALHTVADLRGCVVVTSSDLPDFSGIELAHKLRATPDRHLHPCHTIVLHARSGIDALEETLREADDFVAKPFDPRELRARIQSGLRAVQWRQLLLEQAESLTAQAETDPLTGLRNRRAAQEAALRELERFRRRRYPLAAIMVDIDHFKRINDTYGHPAGDQVLIEVANRLNQGVRPYDILSRWGGEEFLIISPNCGLPDGLHLAERLRHNIAHKPFVLPDGSTIRVTASFGVANADFDSPHLEPLVHCADRALYTAKHRGRNLVSALIDEEDSQAFVASGDPISSFPTDDPPES